MKQIYFDNAATSFPKPKSVADAVYNYITEIGISPNRSTTNNSSVPKQIVYDCRKLISDFFNLDNPQNVVFTKNITESLNVVLQGLLYKGDHVITSNMEHNSVLRPLMKLQQDGVEVSIADFKGENFLKEIESLIKPNTKAIVMTHASNVSGEILPIKEIGTLATKHSIAFVVDTAQTAGVFKIDMKENNINILTFTGHKGLLGIQGLGGFCIEQEYAQKVNPFIYGGTGNFSNDPLMPLVLPFKYEGGTQNMPAIAGLEQAILYINEIGIDKIAKKELELLEYFKNSLTPNDDFYIVEQGGKHCSTVSLNFNVCDNAEISTYLAENGIANRCGLHCAPIAHKTLKTFPEGTVRFSFGYHNTFEEIDYCVSKINEYINLCK